MAAFRGGDELDFEVEALLSRILTKKDKETDSFLSFVAQEMSNQEREEESNFDSQEHDSVFDGCSEESRQLLVDLADQKLQGMSLVLAQRLGPILKEFIVKDQERKIASSYCRIRVPRLPTRIMSENYATCFRQWVESPFVSYKTGNPSDLGGIDAKHVFVLHLWSMMTCFRTRADDMFALCVSGLTSTGTSEYKLLCKSFLKFFFFWKLEIFFFISKGNQRFLKSRSSRMHTT